MKKIICPTDFSPSAQNAVRYAAKLCQAFQAKLTLLNVQSILELTPAELLLGKEFRVETYKQQLDEEAAEVSRMFRISCDAHVADSNRSLATVIGTAAPGYDVLVMGTEGMSSLPDFFEGTNAYRAIQASGIPTLIVPDGTLYSEITEIVYAYDFLRHLDLPLNDIRAMFETHPLQITTVDLLETSTSLEVDKAIEEAEYIINDRNPDLKLRYKTIHAPDAAAAIRDFIHQSTPDLLVLCSHTRNFVQRFFHKSVIKHITATADFPVLVVHK